MWKPDRWRVRWRLAGMGGWDGGRQEWSVRWMPAKREGAVEARGMEGEMVGEAEASRNGGCSGDQQGWRVQWSPARMNN